MHSPLEQYVEELGKGLKALPLHERLEQIDEARAHLEGLATAYQELGHTEAESEAQAIAQFGEATKMARELNATSIKQRWRHAAGVAAIYWGIQFFLSIPISIAMLPFQKYLSTTNVSVLETTINLFSVYLTCSVVLVSLIGGAILKRLVPGNTLRPLLVLTGTLAVIELMVMIQTWVQTGSPNLRNEQLGVLLAFLTSGALREARYEWHRQRRLAA